MSLSQMGKGMDEGVKWIDAELHSFHKHNRFKTSDIRDVTPGVDKLSYVNFNERIGNPWSRLEKKRKPLTPDQLLYINTVHKFNKVIVDKNRKGGFKDWMR